MRSFNEVSRDKKFLNGTLMGPNCLRLCGELTENLPLRPGARVLDLGCGMALTSMFLADRFKVTVFAADLWIDPTDNYERIRAFGMEDRVCPVRAEARALPFAEGYFDAVFCVDAYHYFGAEEGYLENYLAPLIKKGGIIAAAIPGLKEDFTDGVPEGLAPYWREAAAQQGQPEDLNFHTNEWWKALWERSGVVKIMECGTMESHGAAWRDWLETDNEYAKTDVAMMRDGGWEWFNTTKLIALKK